MKYDGLEPRESYGAQEYLFEQMVIEFGSVNDEVLEQLLHIQSVGEVCDIVDAGYVVPVFVEALELESDFVS